jgi:hypothetical protein
MVQGPDGRHVMIAMSWTDYASSAGAEPDLSPPLLAIEGLRQIVRLIKGMRREGCYPAEDAPAKLAGPLPKPMLSDKQKI